MIQRIYIFNGFICVEFTIGCIMIFVFITSISINIVLSFFFVTKKCVALTLVLCVQFVNCAYFAHIEEVF